MFQNYIEWDMSEAKRVRKRGAALLNVEPLPDLFQPIEPETRAALKPIKIFPPLVLKSAKFKIQPILTPDNYREHILPLIDSAKKTLYFQNQYIHYGPNGGDLTALVDALVAAIKRSVDVRIILRDGDTREMLEALKNCRFDMNKIKLQRGCHNKGIVVDSKIAVVSSQNWSGDGVQFNRDAGLIMHSPAVAKFYEQIFLYDWENRATQRAAAERAMPRVMTTKKRGLPAKRGLGKAIAWNDFYGD
jgi:phosphatidylserine/phosphatidylglycerophosphate/cardiolipin synthase-like enzyme